MERTSSLKDDLEGSVGRLVSRTTRNRRQQEKSTPQKWVQCTFCKKWRKVPYHLKDSDLGDRWACRDNIWDPAFASCSVPQALSDEQIDANLKGVTEDIIDPQDDLANGPPPENPSMDFLPSGKYEYESRKQPSPFYRGGHSGNRSMEEIRNGGRYEKNRKSPQESPTKREENIQTGDLSDVAEALLKLGSGSTSLPAGFAKSAFSRTQTQEIQKFVPGNLVWGKVEGHEWWPAKVVRRRSVASEVGPPPGGASEVMYYTPVVFFTPKGIPKEVELEMDSFQFPITVCQRANGLIEEDEAEFAWLSSDNIRPFCDGDTSGRKDGSEVNDSHLRSCIQAAHRVLNAPDPQLSYWKNNEDSDGGWCCAAAFNRNSKQKHKKTTRKKSKRLDEMPSEGDSGPDGGPELLVYGNFMLTPKIAVEQIYAWRRPLTCEQKAKELEREQAQHKTNIRKLKLLSEKLDKKEFISSGFFDIWALQTNAEDPGKDKTVNDGDLVQQEREAVSALLGLGPYNQVDGDSVLPTMDETQYFVKYANRSHIHNEWVNESTLMQIAKRKLTQFRKKFCNRPVNMFSEDWVKPERIVSRRKSKTGPGWELLIKWKDVGIEECTWEAENARILSRPETVLLYIELWKRQTKAMKRNSRSAREKAIETKEELKRNFKPVENPITWLHGCQLHSHQIEALNWCRSCWLQGKGGMLMGEIGQGRTAVLVSFLQCLREEMKCVKPFLLVVPSSHISKWDSEIHFWSGSTIDSVQYQGPHSSKPICLEHEIWQTMECLDGRFPARDSRKSPKADVILISSEVFPMELDNLLEVPWEVVILDLRSVSRLNVDRLANLLIQIQCPCFLTACESPTSETTMLSLLKLLNNGDIGFLDSLYNHEEMSKEEHHWVDELHTYLKRNCFEMRNIARPISQQTYKEFCIPLSFKVEQQEHYKSCLVKHYETMKDEGVHRYSSANIMTLKQILEELCLVCQHPLLLEDEEDWEKTDLDQLVSSSGKLEALGCLLEVLRNSKIHTLLLVHTQKCYSLLLKYLNEKFEKEIFESMSVMNSTADRYSAVQTFARESCFLFLTTSESCGLGMDLAKISCVVIFESAAKSDDDLVALGRAFQIGNLSELPVFRFFIAGSVEERMMQTIKRSDSKANSREFSLKLNFCKIFLDDMKVLEDVLVWGIQGFFDHIQPPQRHPYLPTTVQKSAPVMMNSPHCRALVHNVFNLKMDEEDPSILPQGLPPVRWKLKSKEDIIKEMERPDSNETVRHVNDPLLIAGYWEQLLQSDWSSRRLQEEAKIRSRVEDGRQGLEEMEVDLEKGVGSDQEDHEEAEQPVDEGPKNRLVRRKRMGQDHEGIHGQKKQRSGQKLDHSSSICVEDYLHDENKWSREALLSSKAHQDVLSQIIADPNTLEGKAVLEAMTRVDAVAREFSLPMNIILMVKQIVEILLSLREDRDQGSYFQDYTLLAIICFACCLNGFQLGEKYGLETLAVKYSQDVEVMEQVFKYISKAIWEYKQMLLKIKDLSDHKPTMTEASLPRRQSSTAHVHSSHSNRMEIPQQALHRDLDGFLSTVNETLRMEKDPEIENLNEFLAEPPGAPIKGHIPQQWFPLPVTAETAHLTKTARWCDVEMYLIEKSLEKKVKRIEQSYQSFQEKVRDHGVKALARVSYESALSQNEVENKRKQLKQMIRQNQNMNSLPSSSISNLFAVLQQTQQHWQPPADQKSDSARNLNPPSLHLNSRDSFQHSQLPAQSAVKPELAATPQQTMEPAEAAGSGIGTQWRPPRTQDSAGPLDQLLMTGNGIKLTLEKTGKQLSKPHLPPNPRLLQFPSNQQPPVLNKPFRPCNPALKPVAGGFPRLSSEDFSTSTAQVNQRIQPIPIAQNQPLNSVSTVRGLQQSSPAPPGQLASSYGVLSNIFPNFPNACVLPSRVPHPSLPGMSPFPVPTTLEEPNTHQRNSPVIRMQNPSLEGLTFLSERQKGIQEVPSVRIEPTPAAKVVLSQGTSAVNLSDWSNTGSGTRSGNQSPEDFSTKPPPPPMTANTVVEETNLQSERPTNPQVANATITTGIGRPPDAISSRQHQPVDFSKVTGTPSRAKSIQDPGPFTRMSALMPNPDSSTLDASHFPDPRHTVSQNYTMMSRTKSEGSNNQSLGNVPLATHSLGSDKMTVVSYPWTAKSTRILSSELPPGVKSNVPTVSQTDQLTTGPGQLLLPSKELFHHTGSFNSAAAAVSTSEMKARGVVGELLEPQRVVSNQDSVTTQETGALPLEVSQRPETADT